VGAYDPDIFDAFCLGSASRYNRSDEGSSFATQVFEQLVASTRSATACATIDSVLFVVNVGL
jgi:hypothetical protein